MNNVCSKLFQKLKWVNQDLKTISIILLNYEKKIDIVDQ